MAEAGHRAGTGSRNDARLDSGGVSSGPGGTKKMVPSDPSISSFSGRHARSELGIRKRCDVSPLLPAADFIQLRINALVRVRFYPFR